MEQKRVLQKEYLSDTDRMELASKKFSKTPPVPDSAGAKGSGIPPSPSDDPRM